MKEGELSADLYTFHEAVSHLQEMEEDVLDAHKAVLDQIPKWHQACATLLAMTNEVDYDVDGELGYTFEHHLDSLTHVLM